MPDSWHAGGTAPADVMAEIERLRDRAEAAEARLVSLSVLFPAFRRALTVAIGETTYECEAADYRTALEALGGTETAP
jgi:hypothetical protein